MLEVVIVCVGVVGAEGADTVRTGGGTVVENESKSMRSSCASGDGETGISNVGRRVGGAGMSLAGVSLISRSESCLVSSMLMVGISSISFSAGGVGGETVGLGGGDGLSHARKTFDASTDDGPVEPRREYQPMYTVNTRTIVGRIVLQ